MNKSEIKEARRKLNNKIEVAWNVPENWDFYHANVWKEAQKTWEEDVKDTKEAKKLRTLLYAIERPEVHTINSKLKKIPELRALGLNGLADHYEAFLARYADECEEVMALVPETKPEPKLTPIEELLKRGMKVDDFAKYLIGGKSMVGNYSLNKEDGVLTVGGKKYAPKDEVVVGVRLGRGDRAHKAEIYSDWDIKKDKDGNIIKEGWALFIRRQDCFWRSRDVAILAHWEDIPEELYSER